MDEQSPIMEQFKSTKYYNEKHLKAYNIMLLSCCRVNRVDVKVQLNSITSWILSNIDKRFILIDIIKNTLHHKYLLLLFERYSRQYPIVTIVTLG